MIYEPGIQKGLEKTLTEVAQYVAKSGYNLILSAVTENVPRHDVFRDRKLVDFKSAKELKKKIEIGYGISLSNHIPNWVEEVQEAIIGQYSDSRDAANERIEDFLNYITRYSSDCLIVDDIGFVINVAPENNGSSYEKKQLYSISDLRDSSQKSFFDRVMVNLKGRSATDEVKIFSTENPNEYGFSFITDYVETRIQSVTGINVNLTNNPSKWNKDVALLGEKVRKEYYSILREFAQQNMLLEPGDGKTYAVLESDGAFIITPKHDFDSSEISIKFSPAKLVVGLSSFMALTSIGGNSLNLLLDHSFDNNYSPDSKVTLEFLMYQGGIQVQDGLRPVRLNDSISEVKYFVDPNSATVAFEAIKLDNGKFIKGKAISQLTRTGKDGLARVEIDVHQEDGEVNYIIISGKLKPGVSDEELANYEPKLATLPKLLDFSQMFVEKDALLTGIPTNGELLNDNLLFVYINGHYIPFEVKSASENIEQKRFYATNGLVTDPRPDGYSDLHLIRISQTFVPDLYNLTKNANPIDPEVYQRTFLIKSSEEQKFSAYNILYKVGFNEENILPLSINRADKLVVHRSNPEFVTFTVEKDGIGRISANIGKVLNCTPAIEAYWAQGRLQTYIYETGGSPTREIVSFGGQYFGVSELGLVCGYASAAASPTPTPSPFPSLTLMPSLTFTPPSTPTQKASPTDDPTNTATSTQTMTFVPTASQTNTGTPTSTQTRTPTSAPTNTSTYTPDPTATRTPTSTTAPTATSTNTAVPTLYPTATNTVVPSPTQVPSVTTEPTIVSSPTLQPSNTPEEVVIPSPNPCDPLNTPIPQCPGAPPPPPPGPLVTPTPQ